jgi:hypothetical protein
VTAPAPLPFRIKLPTQDTVEMTTVREVVTTVEGMLHLEGDHLVLEWAMTQTTQEVSVLGVKDESEVFDPEEAFIPLDWLASVALAGGILSPRLELRGRGLRVFEGIPGAKGATLPLHYARGDRMVAVAMVRAIESALTRGTLGNTDEVPQLEP